jgi:hypothetical protein
MGTIGGLKADDLVFRNVELPQDYEHDWSLIEITASGAMADPRFGGPEGRAGNAETGSLRNCIKRYNPPWDQSILSCSKVYLLFKVIHRYPTH